MNELPKCPKCGMEIQVSRHQTPEIDVHWNPIYTVLCGCPDCDDFIVLKCSASRTFIIGAAVSPLERQKYWDFQYELAVEEWKKKYGYKTEEGEDEQTE